MEKPAFESLINYSDELTTELVELEGIALANLEAIEVHKEILEKKNADFYTSEHLIEPVPGDPKQKWNDKRRAAYIQENYAQEIENVQLAELNHRKTTTEIRQVNARINGLNRKIRLLELLATTTE